MTRGRTRDDLPIPHQRRHAARRRRLDSGLASSARKGELSVRRNAGQAKIERNGRVFGHAQ